MVLLVERRMKRGIFLSTGHDYAGLRIVQQIYEGESNNIVVKNGLRSLTRTPMISSSSPVIKSNLISDSTTSNVDRDYFFLKSCQLCKNHLRPDKDVYMYRGDQGFCSIECRNRQIMLDETKEMKARIKNRVAISPLDCRGCETCKLLEELRQRPHHRTNKQPRGPRPILSIS